MVQLLGVADVRAAGARQMMYGRLVTCSRLLTGLAGCKQIDSPINNRPQDTILPCIGTVIVGLLFVQSASAHEIGTSRVSVVFHQSRAYDIELVTDATALAEKLEASTGGSLPAPTRAVDLQSLFVRFDDTFRRRVKIAFDDSAVRPEISYSVVPPIDATAAAAAALRITGEIP